MKVSLVKLPALYGVLYLVWMVAVLIAATGYAVTQGFSLVLVGQTLLSWGSHWWWLSLIGIGLHLFSYVKTLRLPSLLVINGLGICVFIAYALIPNWAPVIMLVHLVVIFGLVRYRRPQHAAVVGGE